KGPCVGLESAVTVERYGAYTNGAPRTGSRAPPPRPGSSRSAPLPSCALRHPLHHLLVRADERAPGVRLAEGPVGLEPLERARDGEDFFTGHAGADPLLHERQERLEIVPELPEVRRTADDRQPRVRVAEDVDRVRIVVLDGPLEHRHPVP